jgi:hypothetical protein
MSHQSPPEPFVISNNHSRKGRLMRYMQVQSARKISVWTSLVMLLTVLLFVSPLVFLELAHGKPVTTLTVCLLVSAVAFAAIVAVISNYAINRQRNDLNKQLQTVLLPNDWAALFAWSKGRAALPVNLQPLGPTYLSYRERQLRGGDLTSQPFNRGLWFIFVILMLNALVQIITGQGMFWSNLMQLIGFGINVVLRWPLSSDKSNPLIAWINRRQLQRLSELRREGWFINASKNQ